MSNTITTSVTFQFGNVIMLYPIRMGESGLNHSKSFILDDRTHIDLVNAMANERISVYKVSFKDGVPAVETVKKAVLIEYSEKEASHE